MLIVHKIRLKDESKASEFEAWVRQTDYATCPKLPSIMSFSVHKNADPSERAHHYLELIHVTDFEAFEADMATDTFHSLEEGFGKYAEVVEEFKGDLITPGFHYEHMRTK